MFQYAIAKAISKKNLDNFKLDVSFYSKQNLRQYVLNHFNIEECIASKSEIIKLAGNTNILYKIKSKLGLKSKRPNSYCKEVQNSEFDHRVFNYKDDIFLDGYWQNEYYFKHIRDTLLKEFTLKNSLSPKATGYLSNMNNFQSVSLHVRRGDYVSHTHTNAFHGICKMDYYLRAIDFISKHILNPIFYIFSDDITWCKENFNFLSNKVYVDDTNSVFDDFELFRNCKHNIIANSSFSWWGSWLNTNTEKIVICPKRWYNNQHLISPACEQWIKL